MITYRNGDLLKSNCNIICHQVNCQGVMGAGIAKQIRLTYPSVFKAYEDYVIYMALKAFLGSLKGV